VTETDARPALTDADFLGLVQEAVDQFGFNRKAEITAFGSLTENPTFRVQEPGVRDPVAVRVYRPGGRPLEEIDSELTWISAIRRETDVSTPAVVPTLTGAQYLRVRDDPPTFMAAFELVPGHEADDEDLERLMPEIGATTARLHLHTKAWRPPGSFERPRWDIETTIGSTPHWGPWQASVPDASERQQLERLAQTVRERLGRFGVGGSRFGLIHADLRVTNLIVDGDSVAVIDFDDCGFSWYLYDLAATLTFYEAAPNVDDLIASWIESYGRIAPLPTEDEQEIPTFLMLRRLLLSAYVGLRADTELAEELRVTHFSRTSCELAERYLSQFG